MIGKSSSIATGGGMLGVLVVHAAGRQRARRKTGFIPPRPPLPRRERIIRVREVLHRAGGVHRATIYKWIKEGRFPRQVSLGANSAGWYESEIDAWIADPTGWRPPDTS